MTMLRILGAVALFGFAATAAVAAQPRDGHERYTQVASTYALSHLSCMKNPSYAFCQTHSGDEGQ